MTFTASLFPVPTQLKRTIHFNNIIICLISNSTVKQIHTSSYTIAPPKATPIQKYYRLLKFYLSTYKKVSKLYNTAITNFIVKKEHKQVIKKFLKKMKRIDAIKRGETRGQIDDIIHNSSYRQSDSTFF